MASDRQIAANRRNAQLSTGPQTQAGKLRSSQNALTHGLTGRSALIQGESETEYEAFCSDLYSYFMPRNEYARSLVDVLADKLWRLKRASKLEALLLEQETYKFKPPMLDPLSRERNDFERGRPGISILRSLIDGVLPKDALGKLNRHEAALLRDASQIRRMLREEAHTQHGVDRFTHQSASESPDRKLLQLPAQPKSGKNGTRKKRS